ncbi:MAG: PHP domain-containing protein [Clostridium chrysemydis]|uniref:PHP domain-containing protein n=1 Tax=Clostridium chrysemydis TaxID=2665504 RepID=UPI003F3651CF
MPFSKEYMQKLQEQFTHLHNHSEYSNIRLLDSINKIQDMILYVSSLGQKALALTDHESLSGHIEFILTVEKLKKDGKIPQDFKVILGNEIYLVDEKTMNAEIEEFNSTSFYHFLLLAKDNEGHRMLRELSTRAWERMFNYKNMDRVPTFYTDFEEVIGDDKGHLIASTACLGGYFPKLVTTLIHEENEDIQENIKDEIDDFLMWCINMFGEDDFYIELQPSQNIDQIEFNKKAIQIAKAYNLKYIITTDSHYLTIDKKQIHEAYLTSNEEGNSNREVGEFYQSTHFFTMEELLKDMSYIDSNDFELAILSTYEISQKITGYNLANDQVIPLTPIPSKEKWESLVDLYEYASKYSNIQAMIDSKDNIYNQYLINLIFQGIKSRVKNVFEYPEVFNRIDIECKELLGISAAKNQPVSGYFTTMVKIIDIIWEVAESIVPPGRGSAGGFILDYLTGITQVNPLKQGVEMPHFRFISAERVDYPDIDIDIPSHKRNKVFDAVKKYYQSIGGDLVRVCTFGTETAKSAIQTACRGLKINGDIGLYLSSLIPIERGKVWGISDCYYGNPKKNRQAITEFKNIVDEWSERKGRSLLEVALGIEGLINKRSSHACGILPVNESFTKHNAKMRTPSGEIVSQFDLHHSEYVGDLKYDFLNTKTASMIQKTLEMLVEYNKIEWQGSLRKTYDKYLHPDVIDRDSEDLWRQLSDGLLISAFQYDSPVGEQAIKSIKPKNFIEAMNGNNLMRLMAEEGKDQPMDIYVRNKLNINEWYKEMEEFGLSEKDIEIVEKHLKQDYGVCSTQERMMLMSMDKNISNFNVVESNILRKGVAKKIGDKFEEAHKLFYEKGLNCGTSKTLLDYIWDVQIAMQKGYGFSVIHSVEYTWILAQQLNLIKYYPSIYWNTSVLLVESGALELEEVEDSDIKAKEKTTQYGKVASAISELQQNGVNVSLPNINKADRGFTPIEEKNEIMFGLKGVMNVNNNMATDIIKNRPYESMEDFYKKMVLAKRKVVDASGKEKQQSIVSNGAMISLIKAGAFNDVSNMDRTELLENYLTMTNPPKIKLDIRESTIDKIIEMGIIPTHLKEYLRLYNFNKYIRSLSFFKDQDKKAIKWYVLEGEDDEETDYITNFFMEHFEYLMQEGEDKGYIYNDKGLICIALGTSRKYSFKKVYDDLMQPFFKWYKSKECLDILNADSLSKLKNKFMQGSISKWEMDSMNFYYSEHELSHVNIDTYGVSDFKELSEEAKVVGFTYHNGMKYPKFELTRIVGTVLDRDKNKHSVALLTPTGVVTVKFYSGQFSFYDKQISIYDEEEDKKTTLEESWFKRGTKLMITGFRRGDQFKPKKYKNSIYQHTVQKILEVDENGLLTLQSERVQGD